MNNDETDFMDYSSKHGLRELEFDFLSTGMKKKIVRLMARIMERAYRRGVQQALVMNGNDSIKDEIHQSLFSYRYDQDLDTSYGLDGYKTSSIQRLYIEEKLENIGLGGLDE